MRLPNRTNLVSRLQRLGRFLCDKSMMTAKLMPPKIMSTPVADRNRKLELIEARLDELGIIENPALLKAETE